MHINQWFNHINVHNSHLIQFGVMRSNEYFVESSANEVRWKLDRIKTKSKMLLLYCRWMYHLIHQKWKLIYPNIIIAWVNHLCLPVDSTKCNGILLLLVVYVLFCVSSFTIIIYGQCTAHEHSCYIYSTRQFCRYLILYFRNIRTRAKHCRSRIVQ